MAKKQDVKERFYKKVVIGRLDECWEWVSEKNSNGYGRFYDENGLYGMAHRFSYRMFYGEFDINLNVLHRCDNPGCVNPTHLFLGTDSDNMQDMWNKHRHPINRHIRPIGSMMGEKNIKAKLRREDVDNIRQMYSMGVGLEELSKKYLVQKPAIWKIVHHRTWI